MAQTQIGIALVLLVMFGFLLTACSPGGSGDSDDDPESNANCADGPLSEPIADCTPSPVPDSGNFQADCVARINQFRWECQCLPPLDRWTAGESCADQHAEYDSTNGAHAGFIANICTPRGRAQNECPDWGSETSIVDGCLQMMWDEGPGDDFNKHGHYINMSSSTYTKVACGIYDTSSGGIWSVQNFE